MISMQFVQVRSQNRSVPSRGEWNGYMERSYRNTMHDSKRVCLKEVIIILE